jgi:hypothetical protein
VEEQEQAIMPMPEKGWRARALLMGGLLGSVLGLLSAYLYIRSAEDMYGGEGPPEGPQTKDALKLGVSLLGIIRTITEWGRH